MNPRKFFGELKRRNVYKVAIAYGVVAWLLMQVASQIFPFFEIPNWAVRLVVLLLVIGFPVAVILAWAFELCCSSLGSWFSNAFIPMFRRQFLHLWGKASRFFHSTI
jgi:hypothetical protein